jgi:hypothetical protein
LNHATKLYSLIQLENMLANAYSSHNWGFAYNAQYLSQSTNAGYADVYNLCVHPSEVTTRAIPKRELAPPVINDAGPGTANAYLE